MTGDAIVIMKYPEKELFTAGTSLHTLLGRYNLLN